MKKLKETINDSFYISGGIFSLIASLKYFDWFSDSEEALSLDYEYYLNRSGDKVISPLYQKLLDNTDEALVSLCHIIKLKYYNKRQKIYETYIESEYDPLTTIKKKSIRTPNLTTDSSSKVGSEITSSNTNQGENGIYGYNSASSVPANSSNSSSKTTTIGDKEKNTSEGTTNYTGNEEYEISGYQKGNITENVESEIDLRARYNLYTIMEEDVDTLLTQSVYDIDEQY